MCLSLQGSSWSRSKLKFVTHDSSPPRLSTRIAPGMLCLLLLVQGFSATPAFIIMPSCVKTFMRGCCCCCCYVLAGLLMVSLQAQVCDP
jgi:hypothetical protein